MVSWASAKEIASAAKLFCSAGPPGQVASLAGKKDGMKQGELGGILKELGYTEEQVRVSCGSVFLFAHCMILQVYKF